LQYADQPIDEWLVIGMEPIMGSNGHLKVFEVEYLGLERQLGGYLGSPGDFLYAYRRLVFLRPRK
jgi:hypothetical protein